MTVLAGDYDFPMEGDKTTANNYLSSGDSTTTGTTGTPFLDGYPHSGTTGNATPGGIY